MRRQASEFSSKLELAEARIRKLETHNACYVDTIDFLEKQLKELKEASRESRGALKAPVSSGQRSDESGDDEEAVNEIETERVLNPAPAHERQETFEGMVSNARRPPSKATEQLSQSKPRQNALARSFSGVTGDFMQSIKNFGLKENSASAMKNRNSVMPNYSTLA